MVNMDKNKFKEIKKIVEQKINEGVYDPALFKAIFLAGGPGSGKSFIQRFTTSGLGLKKVNSDQAFEKFMKDNGLNFKMPDHEKEKRVLVRSRAKQITKKRKYNYQLGKLGLVIDGTGRDYNKIKRQVLELRELGYDTYMIFVNTSREVALARNRKRARSVPEDIVINSWNAVQDNIGKFQSLFGSNNFSIIDNNEKFEGDLSNHPVLIKMYKKVKDFVNRPLKNYIAKKWISYELIKRIRQ